MLYRYPTEKLLKQVQRRGHKPQTIQQYRFDDDSRTHLFPRVRTQFFIDVLHKPYLINQAGYDAQMIDILDN